MITPEEFAEQMVKIVNTDTGYHGIDIEMNHVHGDNLMEETLIELGYGDGVEVFRDMPKWYA